MGQVKISPASMRIEFAPLVINIKPMSRFFAKRAINLIILAAIDIDSFHTPISIPVWEVCDPSGDSGV
jgi:hypothetical protein